jgi:hypothetical protein
MIWTKRGISRRRLVKTLGAAGVLLSASPLSAVASRAKRSGPVPIPAWDVTRVGAPLMRDPVWVYDNWSAYTDGYYKIHHQLEDDTRLTEELSLKQMVELARLKELGLRFDYYMMNAFWFDPDGAYRVWRKGDWPQGPDRWIEACHKNGLKPGLWFGTNTLWQINPAPRWLDSLAVKTDPWWQSMSFYEGGFFEEFMTTVQYWYDRGVRMFEFDTANFDAATERATKEQSPEEIREKNMAAFRRGLQDFRRRNPDAMLVAFNWFGGDILTTATPFPFKKPIDLRWLEVFDTLYSGDVRVSDVPQVNFWRSVDLFNDHMVRRFEQSAVPLERIDPFFTLSTTWFGYKRGKRAWKGMLLSTVARGSWKKTIYGDLSLLSEEDARWFAKVQSIFGPLTALGRTKTFGGIPGEIAPYGFAALDTTGAIYTIVNPTQQTQQIEIPRLSNVQELGSPGRVLFRDAGYVPKLKGTSLSLGPEQMCLVGFGRYAQPTYDLGVEEDIVIPNRIENVGARFSTSRPNAVTTEVLAPAKGDLRVIFSQRAADGSAPRTANMKIEAVQKGRPVEIIQPDQERAITTGISWGAGEIRGERLVRGQPVTISCSSSSEEPVTLSGSVYVVEYDVT